MEKKELQRKIIGTTVAAVLLSVLLVISVILLVMTDVFSLEVKVLMLACCLVLAIAIGGFVWSKIIEIRTLRLEMNGTKNTQSLSSEVVANNTVAETAQQPLAENKQQAPTQQSGIQEMPQILEEDLFSGENAAQTDTYLDDINSTNVQHSVPLQNALPQENTQNNVIESAQNNTDSIAMQNAGGQMLQSNIQTQGVQQNTQNSATQIAVNTQNEVQENIVATNDAKVQESEVQNTAPQKSAPAPLNWERTAYSASKNKTQENLPNSVASGTAENNAAQTVNTQQGKQPPRYAELFKKQAEKSAADQAAHRAANIEFSRRRAQEMNKPVKMPIASTQEQTAETVQGNVENINNGSKPLSPYSQARMMYEEQNIEAQTQKEYYEKLKKQNEQMQKSKANATAAVSAANDAATRASEAAAKAEARLLALAGLADDESTAPTNN